MKDLDSTGTEIRHVELLKMLLQHFYRDMPLPTQPQEIALRDVLAEMSIRELLAFCWGCMTNPETWYAKADVSFGGLLHSISEDTTETDDFREMAGSFAREFLRYVAMDLFFNRFGDEEQS